MKKMFILLVNFLMITMLFIIAIPVTATTKNYIETFDSTPIGTKPINTSWYEFIEQYPNTCKVQNNVYGNYLSFNDALHDGYFNVTFTIPTDETITFFNMTQVLPAIHFSTIGTHAFTDNLGNPIFLVQYFDDGASAGLLFYDFDTSAYQVIGVDKYTFGRAETPHNISVNCIFSNASISFRYYNDTESKTIWLTQANGLINSICTNISLNQISVSSYHGVTVETRQWSIVTENNILFIPDPDIDVNMYVRLWDYETGERLAFSHEQTPYETMQKQITVFPSARILINDLAVTYDREIYTKDQYIGLKATINSGINRIQLIGIGYMLASPGYEYHGFIWNNRYTPDGSYLWKPFYNHDINITISQGSIIDIYLIPWGYTEQPENTKQWNFYNDLICEISTDKNVYTSGEQMIITYKIPSIQEFDAIDYETFGWSLAIHKDGLGWINRLYGDFTTDAEYVVPNDDFDIIYGYTAIIYLDVDDLGLSAGVNDFEINIGHVGGGLLWQNRFLTKTEGLWFKVINGTFTPNGTIADIEPDYPLIGERTLISFTANNRGKLVYQDLLDLTHQEYVITTFEKPIGAIFVNTSFYSIAPYKVTLYVWDGYLLQDVDNAFVQVNGSGENYSGYNIEYCEISKDRYIAGFSYAEIAYHSLNTSATFIIKTPKDERSRYSTILTETEGVYRFKIDAFSQIGKYNVTFIGLDTYYSYFYVVYNENNYIEFAKNVFTTNENFALFVRNDVRIGLTFYQKDMHDNYVPRGENIYFTENTIASYVTIDKSQVKPEIGEWRVEMWQVNDRARIRLLATWDCTVIQYSASTDLPPVNIDIINSIPYALKLFLGILIPILFAIIPLLVIAFISKTGREIDNLGLICVAFFFFGMFISILLTFLPVASIFIVLLGVIVTFALMYIQRKEG